MLLSTRPVRAGAAVQGPRRGIVVEIRDAYDTEADRYQSDGYLEGELLSAPAENRPGRPTLPAGSLAARPLPRVPLSSDVRTRLDLPFTRPAARDDTLRVRGMLRPQTTRLPAGREVVVDRDSTPSARLREPRVTYEFSEDGSARVSALVGDDTTAVEGTWNVEADTLRIRAEEDTLRAHVRIRDRGVVLTSRTVQCRTAIDRARCRTAIEASFGLVYGSLSRAVRRFRNELVPAAASTGGTASDPNAFCTAPRSRAKRGASGEVDRLLRGRPSVPPRPVRAGEE